LPLFRIRAGLAIMAVKRDSAPRDIKARLGMRRRTPSEPLRSYQRREQINEKKNRKDQRDIDHPCSLTIVASDFVAGFEKKDA